MKKINFFWRAFCTLLVLVGLGTSALAETITLDFSSTTNLYTTNGGSTRISTGRSNSLATFYYKDGSTYYPITLTGTNRYFLVSGTATNSSGAQGILLGKSGATMKLPALEGKDITNVSFKNTSGASVAVTFSVLSGENVIAEDEKWSSKGSTISVDIPAAYKNSQLTYKVTNGNNSQINQIVITYTTSGGTPSGPTALSVPTNLASSNVTTTGATLSWGAVANASSYTVKIGETEHTGVNTNSYSATGLTAGTQYTWTVKAVGDGSNYTTSDYAANANFTTEEEQGGGGEPSGEGSWTKCLISELTASDIFVIVDANTGKAMTNNNGTSSAPAASEVTISQDENTITGVTDAMKWNISGDGTNGYTFYPNGSTTTWLYATATNNGVRVGDNDNKTFKIANHTNDEPFLQHVGTSRYIGVYNSQDWRCYTSINSNINTTKTRFYKYVAGEDPGDQNKTTPSLSFANPTYNATMGEAFVAPTLTKSHEVTVSYTSSEIGVATVNSTTGAIELVAPGTTKITASFGGNDTYKAASASYQLVVAAAPLTTMDAIFEAATAAGSTATDCRVTFNNWVVSGVKNNNAYVTDNAGKGFIVYQTSHGFVAGDILSGTAACKVQLYNGSSELTTLTSSSEGLTVTKGGVITPITTIALASLSGVNTGAVVSYEDLEYDGTNFTDGATNLKPYNGLIALPDLISGKNYNVTGVYVQYNATKEIAPRTAEDFELIEVINYYTVTFAETLNGTITVKNGETIINDGDEVAEGTTLTIECTPDDAENYRFQNWQYKEGEGSWTPRYTNPQNYTMPSANVQFKANFEVIPTYTVAFSVNGTIVQTDDLKDGAAVTAPSDPEDINGKVFTGWIETATVVGATPAYVTPITTATKTVTYYAVFATASAGGASQENEITYNTENIPTSYADAADVTLNGATFNVTQMYKNGEKMQWRAGNKAGTGAMYNKTAFDGIQSIAITYTNDDTNKNFTVKVGSSENPTSGTEISAVQDGETSTYVYDCSSIAPSYFVLTNGSGAGYLSSIVITYGGGNSYSDYTTIVADPAPEYGEVAMVATDGDGNYYATFSCSRGVIFDAEQMIEVQTVSVLEGALVFNTESDESYSCVTDKTKDEGWVVGYYVPANIGVLIYSVTNDPVRYYYVENHSYNILNDVDGDNMLRAASVTKETDGSYKFYKLAYASSAMDNLGFYWGADQGAAFTSREGSAYLAVPVSTEEGELAPVRFVFNNTDQATGVENVESNDAVKLIENGVLYILRDGVRYNALGQMVK